MKTAKKEKKTVNGLNVTQLFDTIDSIRKNPEISKFKFRASDRWIAGAHNRATVKDFHGALQEDDSRKALAFKFDEPPVLLGSN